MLRFDFYESGVGETTIITFPDDGIAIIDAHPSNAATRPEIIKLIKDKQIHFICLTHPHKDHAKDLAEITKRNADIPVLWHTLTDIHQCAYFTTEYMKYPSGQLESTIERIRKEEAMPIIELFANIAQNKIATHRLRSDLEKKDIAGVEVFCLSPTEKQQQHFFDCFQECLQGQRKGFPDKNLLSAILAFRYGKTVFVHGGDALKENWRNAVEKYFSLIIPNATIIKIPHHGSANAFIANKGKHQHNYLDLCDNNKEIKSVLFAGRSNQPNANVYDKLLKKTRVFCTANGLKSNSGDPLGLSLAIPGSKFINDSRICNPRISFECDDQGNIKILNGHDCDNCK